MDPNDRENRPTRRRRRGADTYQGLEDERPARRRRSPRLAARESTLDDRNAIEDAQPNERYDAEESEDGEPAQDLGSSSRLASRAPPLYHRPTTGLGGLQQGPGGLTDAPAFQEPPLHPNQPAQIPDPSAHLGAPNRRITRHLVPPNDLNPRTIQVLAPYGANRELVQAILRHAYPSDPLPARMVTIHQPPAGAQGYVLDVHDILVGPVVDHRAAYIYEGPDGPHGLRVPEILAPGWNSAPLYRPLDDPRRGPGNGGPTRTPVFWDHLDPQVPMERYTAPPREREDAAMTTRPEGTDATLLTRGEEEEEPQTPPRRTFMGARRADGSEYLVEVNPRLVPPGGPTREPRAAPVEEAGNGLPAEPPVLPGPPPWEDEYHPTERLPEEVPRLSSRRMDEILTSRPLVEADRQEEDGTLECGICSADNEIGDAVESLPCDHWFHRECIRRWFGMGTTCPKCRRHY